MVTFMNDFNPTLPQAIILFIIFIIIAAIIGMFCFKIIGWCIINCFEFIYVVLGFFKDKKNWLKVKYKDFKNYYDLNEDNWEIGIDGPSIIYMNEKYKPYYFYIYYKPSDTFINIGFLQHIILFYYFSFSEFFKSIKERIRIKEKEKKEHSEYLIKRKIKFITSMSKEIEKKREELEILQKESDNIIFSEIDKMKNLV